MSKIKLARTAQYPLFKTQIINFDDFFVTGTNPATNGPAFGAGGVSVPVALPPGARVVGGGVFVDTPFTGGTGFAIDIGDANSPQRYVAAESIFAAPANDAPIGLPNFANLNGDNIVITGTATGGPATAGKIAVTVAYIIDGRSNENQIT